LTTAKKPPIELPAAACPARQAYAAMVESKEAHYGFLEHLDIKYKNGGVRSLAERARLETLLAEHDICVAKFSEAVKVLGATDVEARDILVRFMSQLAETENNATH